MAVDHGASSAAAAASSDELAPEEAGPDSGANVKVGLLAAGGPTPSEAGRAPSKRKPKIDIDHEIQEANRLAELFRKMQNASKQTAVDEEGQQTKRTGFNATCRVEAVWHLRTRRGRDGRCPDAVGSLTVASQTFEGPGAHLRSFQDVGLISSWCRGGARRARQIHQSSCVFVVCFGEVVQLHVAKWNVAEGRWSQAVAFAGGGARIKEEKEF